VYGAENAVAGRDDAFQELPLPAVAEQQLQLFDIG
jgi:hypothetical protein